jgi:hypothetical protein
MGEPGGQRYSSGLERYIAKPSSTEPIEKKSNHSKCTYKAIPIIEINDTINTRRKILP